MSIRTKIAAVAIASLTLTGGLAAATQAEAGYHGGGVGIGIAAGLLGAAIVSNAYAQPAYVVNGGYRRCGWVRQFYAYGNYMGRVRSCGY